jgi:hypothetical protein
LDYAKICFFGPWLPLFCAFIFVAGVWVENAVVVWPYPRDPGVDPAATGRTDGRTCLAGPDRLTCLLAPHPRGWVRLVGGVVDRPDGRGTKKRKPLCVVTLWAWVRNFFFILFFFIGKPIPLPAQFFCYPYLCSFNFSVTHTFVRSIFFFRSELYLCAFNFFWSEPYLCAFKFFFRSAPYLCAFNFFWSEPYLCAFNFFFRLALYPVGVEFLDYAKIFF